MNYSFYDNQKFAPELVSFIKQIIVANNTRFVMHAESYLCRIFKENIDIDLFQNPIESVNLNGHKRAQK